MGNTKIEWCDTVWNVVTGCTKVSPGCSRCYAYDVAKRFWKGRPFEDVRFHEDRLFKPLHWRKPRRVFVNSMSDLFHENLRDHQIYSIFDVMRRASQHTFQVLTKRADRMYAYMKDHQIFVLPNVWLGVSVENQAMADERLPILHATPAAVRFISAESLLGPIEISPGSRFAHLAWLDWVIVGGESGRQARPCNLEWIHDIVEQCRASSVPCFVKQLGAKAVVGRTKFPLILHDTKGGNIEEWPSDLRVREFPKEQAHA